MKVNNDSGFELISSGNPDGYGVLMGQFPVKEFVRYAALYSHRYDYPFDSEKAAAYFRLNAKAVLDDIREGIVAPYIEIATKAAEKCKHWEAIESALQSDCDEKLGGMLIPWSSLAPHYVAMVWMDTLDEEEEEE